jgi:hypothetical protein
MGEETSMKRSLRAIVAVLTAGVVVLIALIVGGPIEARAFTGSTQFDFGHLDFVGSALERTHVFSLKNTSDRAVRIERVVSSCGCAVADVTPRTLPPGQEVKVTAQLTFQNPGYRQATISLVFGDRSPLNPTLSGTADRVHSLYAAQRAVRLEPLSERQVTLVATSLGSEAPPAVPRVEAQHGVACTSGDGSSYIACEVTSGVLRGGMV